ncbi:ABC transporter substrate-binding protein [Spiroplasma endosymbiont of Othius punctulatus]|uniref:ABC transporter substrate-binding protein n=1 Tax=Spiroplasma endosymbiont of Othius punctulatus TaxID=3066289 RepID=UPI0030CE9C37
MKKLVISLASIMGISLSTTAIVSCGITFDVLLKRKVDTNEFKGYFQFNPNSLVSAKTMQAQDFELISDLNVPLVSVDQFGRTIGELAVKFNPAFGDNEGDISVGANGLDKTHPDSDNWTYLLNQNAKWTNSSLQEKGAIRGTDFLNIFLYILHPNTASETKSFWSSYINGADEIIQFVNGNDKEEESTAKEKRFESVYKMIKTESADGTFDGMDGKGLNIEGKEYKLGIKIGKVGDIEEIDDEHPGMGMELISNKSDYITWYGPDGIEMPFFDSLMSYASFAPIPDQAVDISNTKYSFSNYMTTENFKESGLFSGPFVLKNLQLSQSVEYARNPDYVNLEDIKFAKMVKTYKSKATDGELRTSFEAGDLSELKLRPTDPQGWSKYVGSDPLNNPTFDSVVVEKSRNYASYGMYMNAINADLWKTNKSKAELNTRVLSSSLIRQYIMTTVQKSWMSKYFSSAFDSGERHKSETSINTLTPFDFAKDDDGVDYYKYLAEALSESGDETEVNAIFEDLKPGNDFFSKYDNAENEEDKKAPIGYELIRGKDDEEFINKVKNELIKINPTNEKIVLSHLTNGAQANTQNIYIQNMIDIFNRDAKDEGINISIKQDQTNDESEFRSKRTNAQYDIVVTGWSPDYADPVSFLKSQSLDGDLVNYFGAHRMIDSAKVGDILKPHQGDPSFLWTYDALEAKGLLDKTGVYVPIDSKTKDSIATFINDYVEYTNLVNVSSTEGDLSKRYTEFAKAEKKLLIEKAFMIPIYDPWVLPSVKMTFVNPYHYSNVGYGTSQYVHRGWEILPQMPPRAQINKIKKAYDKYNDDDERPNSGLCLTKYDKDLDEFDCK